MKISFNDKSLQTTFEYPPESSLQEEEAEEEEEGDVEEDAEASGPESVPEKHLMLFLPRATFVSSVGPESPRLPDGSSSECLSGRAGGRAGMCGAAPVVGLQPHVHPFGLQACPATRRSTPWLSASGRSRCWSGLQAWRRPHPRRSW